MTALYEARLHIKPAGEWDMTSAVDRVTLDADAGIAGGSS